MSPILIAGGGALAAAVERRLSASGVSVARLRLQPDDEEGEHRLQERIQDAAALLLVADDDAGNADLALHVRRMRPGLPLVVRLFDPVLVSYLSQTLPGVRILSMSGLAAPAFAEAARRVLPAQPVASPSGHPAGSRRRRRFRVDRILALALISFFVLIFPSALFFAHALNLRYMDALYFVWTTVMTVGYGDIALKDASDGAKLFGMALMLAGASFIAVLFALLSDWVMSRRLDVLRGRTRVRGHGHVLLAGAGNIGLRVAGLLAESGRHMVFVERDAENPHVATLSAAGHHVIIADATSEEMLELAGVSGAAVVLAVTDSDAANLQIALHARAHGVPVIMRMLSPELSAHVTEHGDGIALSPVAIAAESFAEAALAAAKPGEDEWKR